MSSHHFLTTSALITAALASSAVGFSAPKINSAINVGARAKGGLRPATSALESPLPASLAQADRDAIGQALNELQTALTVAKPDPDAELYYKSAIWALRYDPTFSAADIALIKKMLRRGKERAEAAAAGAHPWALKKGKLVRGYRSKVDGSIQPYGLIIPSGYSPGHQIRLDVVLHGSTRPVGMSELRFLSRFEEGDKGGSAPDQPYIELHPLGRVENGYRWAGETDVFEAIEDVCSKYGIDRDRVVLRGMSMGASGTWHLGLKNPDRFVALGPYCGYVDTHRFSETPLDNFVKVGPLPEVQERMLHLLDSVDYAANAGVVPAIAAIGDQDVFFQAHVIMGNAMRQEGLEMVNLISKGTGHVQDPPTFQEQLRRIQVYADKGLDHAPSHLRFVTWSLKYSRCHWLEVLGMEQYRRAELEARIEPNGLVRVEPPKNVTRFAIRPSSAFTPTRVRVGTERIQVSPERTKDGRPIVIENRGGHWRLADSSDRPSGKSPGLQGPIDDAFTQPFLCVRGTGKPWSPAVAAWSNANLDRFAYEWNRYFRGDLPIKNDTEVTEEDLRTRNLILFGDPGSNRLIEKALSKLPIRWSRKELQIGANRYPGADHAPSLVCASPLDGAEGHYLVLNSGHTFHEAELSTLNYLLFPRQGDYAVFKVGSKLPAQPAGPLDETLVQTGLCDEQWRIPAK